MDVADSNGIPLPGDVDAEEESPFLRRHRPIPVRRSRFFRGIGTLVRSALFGLLLLPVGYGGYHAATFALTSTRFMMNSAAQIVVSGNHFVSREEIVAALGIPVGGASGVSTNIFRLSLAEKKAQVESIPWVRSATLIRAYPNHLAVRILERIPIAFVNVGGQVKLFDSEGVLLERPERAVFNFPVLTGVKGVGGEAEPAARRERFILYREFMRQLEPDTGQSGWLISEVDLADPDDLRALLVQGHETIQVHFGNKDFVERFHNFLALLPEIRKADAKIDSVDLRYRNQIVVNPVAGAPGRSAHTSGRLGDTEAQKE